MNPAPDTAQESAAAIPAVVIAGRPNVGKSSLFNALARRRLAIVDPTSGTTRDRIATLVETDDLLFELWDTGGVGMVDQEEIAAEVAAQIDLALRHADLILFVVDIRQGYNEADHALANRLRALGRPIILVANKADDPRHALAAPELERLGLGPPLVVSALHRTGLRELLEHVRQLLPRRHTVRPAPAALQLAIVGCRNVGKSSLVNRLARTERMIVSEIPGTTRDAVDVRFEWQGRAYLVIDTAGLKRHMKHGHPLDFYSAHRAERSIRRADVVCLMLDATREISRTDKRLAGYIEAQAKPCLLLINKWDLAAGVATADYARYLTDRLGSLQYAPLLFISAKTGHNVEKLLPLAHDLYEQAGRRVATADLNRALADALAARQPRRTGRVPRVLYATQTGVHPPTLVFFVNDARLFTPAYQRFLANFFRTRLPFPEVPLRLYFRTRRAGHAPAAPAEPSP